MITIEEHLDGHGQEAKTGDKVEIHYTGTFPDGKKFDSSLDRNQTFTFQLGAGQVIQGFDMGVTGMKVGGKRKITIPPNLGYGSRGAGKVYPARPDAGFRDRARWRQGRVEQIGKSTEH
ncbi:MAG: FKBP-type peptidyl-prolyl cis-trans isomerase [Fimbriimonadales bacterium]